MLTNSKHNILYLIFCKCLDHLQKDQILPEVLNPLSTNIFYIEYVFPSVANWMLHVSGGKTGDEELLRELGACTKNAEANLSLHYDEQGGTSLFRKQQ